MSTKINQLLLEWVPGDLHGLDWLKERGLDQPLVFYYYKSGLLRKVGPGVFCRHNDKVQWQGLIKYLQSELEIPIHISGKTALELQGQGHYANLTNKPSLYITSYKSSYFPEWAKLSGEDFQFVFKKSSLLKNESYLTRTEDKGIEIKLSTRELAILELIEDLDLSNSLETVENYLNSLRTLRADMLQALLEECKSVKVKRVFLYLSEKLEMPYLQKLELKKINIGSGKRMVVRGGKLNKKFLITVDKQSDENSL